MSRRSSSPARTSVYATKISWTTYIPGLLVLIAAIVVFVLLDVAFPSAHWVAIAGGLILLALACYLLVREWFERWTTEIAITNRRIILKRGFIRRDTAEMHMDKVESVDVNQSLLGRLLDYGDVTVRGTGAGLETLRLIDARSPSATSVKTHDHSPAQPIRADSEQPRMIDQYPSLSANWSYPTAVRFGPGRIVELPEALKAAGIARPLFVTDPGLVDLPIVAKALDILKKANVPVAVFSKVDGNPTLKNLEDGLAAYKAGGHDGVIAFGGGSGMDVGKLDRLHVRPDAGRSSTSRIARTGGRAPTPKGIAPIVAVPTTAGTGSEVGRAAVITDPADHTKKIIFHPLMLPKVVIADPELTLDLPAKITAWTGMDALSHCLEVLVQPVLPSARRGHRARRDAPRQGVAAGRRRRRQEHQGPRLHAGRLVDGGGRVPEGPRRHARHEPSVLEPARHPSRPHQCGGDALCARPQPLAIEARLAALARYLDLAGHSPQSVIDWVLRAPPADRHPEHAARDRRRRGHGRGGRADGGARSLDRAAIPCR